MVQMIFSAILLILLAGTGAYAGSPISITSCEKITKPGDYVLANDLVFDAESGFGGNCLIITASNVHLDMEGLSISVACLPSRDCVPVYGSPTIPGDGIEITKGANDVSIKNGQ